MRNFLWFSLLLTGLALFGCDSTEKPVTQKEPVKQEPVGTKEAQAVASTVVSVVRQIAAAAVIGLGLWQVRPWLGGIDHTSLDGAVRLAAVLVPTGLIYVAGVSVLGGTELKTLLATFKGSGDE